MGNAGGTNGNIALNLVDPSSSYTFGDIILNHGTTGSTTKGTAILQLYNAVGNSVTLNGNTGANGLTFLFDGCESDHVSIVNNDGNAVSLVSGQILNCEFE